MQGSVKTCETFSIAQSFKQVYDRRVAVFRQTKKSKS
jgi:hypothetical protein